MEHSAGILLYRWNEDPHKVQVLLVHPGGPYWQHRYKGWWSIPKGKVEEGENVLAAAKREFEEEIGVEAGSEGFRDLGMVRQSKTKNVSVWALERDYDPSTLKSNTCEIEYPAGSGERLTIPEIDQAQWFDLALEAYDNILPGQRRFLFKLASTLGWRGRVCNDEDSQ